MSEYRHGLVIVNTGDGKGKTTAALGLAMRAWGEGMRVLILQFIKGGWKYGELNTLEALGERIEVHQCGKGFTQRDSKNKEMHQKAAQDTLQRAKEEITSDKWDMIILDEINYAVKFELITVEDVLELLAARPSNLHLVITGRDAKPEIIEKADLVTEMKLIKHPFESGIKAQKGIEF